MVDFQSRETDIAFLPVEIVGDGEIAVLPILQPDTFEDADEAAGILVGQRFEESGIDEGEDCDAGGHSEGEHDDRGKGEAEIFPELAQSETKILERRLEPEADYVAALLFEHGGVAELAIGGVVRFGFVEAGGLEVLLLQFAVIGHFFGEVGFEFLALGEEPEFVEKTAE